MSQDFTLIDVENGMFDLSLHTVLTSPCFAFFWGIIQTCNRFKPRFKNPFTLTVAQAMAAGGGVSRQAVWDKQQRLAKVRIGGEWLVKITPGSRKDNTAAKYKINYKLIVGETVENRPSTEQPSNIIDEQRTNNGRTTDVPLTILRSDQKRGEEDHHTTSNIVTTSEGPKTEKLDGGDGIFSTSEKTEEELKRISDELRFRQVRDPICKQLAKEYDTRYLERQMLQIDRDFLKQIRFNNPGGALVARIKSGHVTEDYQE